MQSKLHSENQLKQISLWNFSITKWKHFTRLHPRSCLFKNTEKNSNKKIIEAKSFKGEHAAREASLSRAIYFRAHFAFYQLICNCFIVSFFNSTAMLTIAWASVKFFFLAHRAVNIYVDTKGDFAFDLQPTTIHIVFAMLQLSAASLNLSILIGTQFALIVNVFLSFSFVQLMCLLFTTICFAKASNTWISRRFNAMLFDFWLIFEFVVSSRGCERSYSTRELPGEF